jgi:Mce-associated membrane protein
MDPEDDIEVRTAERSKPLLLVSIVLVAAAFLAMSLYGWSWWQAAHDENLEFSRVREDVRRATSIGVANILNRDSSKPDEALARLRDTFTGELLQDVQQRPDDYKKTIVDRKSKIAAKILEVVVTQLDARAGTASAIVAAELIETPEGAKPETMLGMSRISLQAVDHGWKLSYYEPAVPGVG